MADDIHLQRMPVSDISSRLGGFIMQSSLWLPGDMPDVEKLYRNGRNFQEI